MKILDKLKSSDNVAKTIYSVKYGIVELSHIDKNDGRDIICVPTMYYCKLGCKFCHMTNPQADKFSTKLIEEETILELLEHFITDNNINKKKLLLSFMGVGEPSLNFQMIEYIWSHKRKLGKGKKVEFALATMFPTYNTFKTMEQTILEKNIPVKIYGSLHSVNDELRKQLIPSSSVTVRQCFELLRDYNEKAKGKVNLHESDNAAVFHYTIIDKVNDSELEQLKQLASEYKIPIKLIVFNEVNDMVKYNDYLSWQESLSEIVPCSVYLPPGKEIGSSCGQLTMQYYLSHGTKKRKEILSCPESSLQEVTVL